MTHPLTPREKVELKPCPFCGGETISTHSQDTTEGPAYFWHKCETCGAETEGDYGEADAASVWNRRTALASGSGDHAELAGRLRRTFASFEHDNHGGYGRCGGSGRVWVDDGMASNFYDGGTCDRCADNTTAPINPDGPAAADALEALLAENAALRAERDQIAGESIWWKGVIGDGPYRPSGEVRSIKHLHPAMVKPIYEANKGTAVADVIAGLIFLLAINQNREQFLVADANERRTEAERKLAEAEGLVERSIDLMTDEYADTKAYREEVRTFLSKEAERG